MTALQLPKVKLDAFMEFIKSKAVITAGAAILVTPILLKTVEKIRQRVPFLKDHITIGMLIAGFAIFLIAGVVAKDGTLRVVLIGVAAGVAITGLAPFFEDFIGRIAPT